MDTLTDKLAAALRAASYALTELDPLAHQHDAAAIDEALGAYSAYKAEYDAQRDATRDISIKQPTSTQERLTCRTLPKK